MGVAASSGQRLSIVSSVVLILAFVAALVVLRRGRFRLAVALTALAFLPGQAISLLSAGTHESGLIVLLSMIPLTLVGLLGARWALLTTIGAIIVMVDIQRRALEGLEHSSARRLLLDITGVPIVDSQVAQGLITVIQAARLLGAEVVLIGIRPQVAQSLVQLGIDLTHVVTSVDLQTALHNNTRR